MARHDHDIPIRPRYGISEPDDELEEDEEAESKTKPTIQVKARKSSTNLSTDKMSSSYSEIPFLAKYPGAVPEHEQINYDLTPTGPQQHPCRNDSLEEEDDSEDQYDNSKSSSCEASKTPKRPDSLQYDSSFPYELEGADGEMKHFVAKNLEEQLRTTSPMSKRDPIGYSSHNSTPSTSAKGLLTRHFLQTQLPQIDVNVLSDIEIEAQYLAASVDNLTENLCNLLHSISSITADNVEVHKNAVNKLTDSMDANIKCMYTIMAKTEEISKSMKPTELLGNRIREVKRLVDMLD